jgi:hypothetical protein
MDMNKVRKLLASMPFDLRVAIARSNGVKKSQAYLMALPENVVNYNNYYQLFHPTVLCEWDLRTIELGQAMFMAIHNDLELFQTIADLVEPVFDDRGMRSLDCYHQSLITVGYYSARTWQDQIYQNSMRTYVVS